MDDIGWDDDDWEGLLLAIEQKECTPFLGAGACFGTLPLGGQVARQWAEQDGFPFEDKTNLVRVAQYVAVTKGSDVPKRRIIKEFEGKGPPNYDDENEPHRLVADLRLPLYVTTNYDDFMLRALERGEPKRTPQRAVCKWHLARQRRKPDEPLPDPTPDAPLVYHLHGHLGDRLSMVLTEDDYLEFLMATATEPELIPPLVQAAFATTSLLFLGYSLEDTNFKVLFRRLSSYLQINQGSRHVSVQLAPRPDEDTAEFVARAEKQREYLQRHFDNQKIKVYWGTCQQFCADLRARWGALKHVG